MTLKKQMIKTSLLAFGLSMGVGTSSALAAPPTETNVQVQKSPVFQKLKESEVFQKFLNTDWNNINYQKKMPLYLDRTKKEKYMDVSGFVFNLTRTIESNLNLSTKERILLQEDYLRYKNLLPEERKEILGPAFEKFVTNYKNILEEEQKRLKFICQEFEKGKLTDEKIEQAKDFVEIDYKVTVKY